MSKWILKVGADGKPYTDYSIKTKAKALIGLPRMPTPEKNCLKCKFYSECTDSKRKHNYRCSRFKARAEIDWDNIFGAKKKRTKKVKAREYSDETSEDFDVFKIIDSIVEEETGIPRDLKIDDRDIPQAANFYQFLVDPRFLDFRPWAKQLQIGLNFFTEYCHNPKCSDVPWMKEIPVDASVDDILTKATLLRHGVCPKCKQNRIHMWNDYKAGRYNQLAGLAGQRSAKSTTVGLMMAYHMHRFIMLPNPPLVYGMLPNAQIHSTVTATTFKQAKESLYDGIHEIITSAPWFKEYHAMLDQYGARQGEELYKLRTEFIQYRHRNFLFYAAAPDQRNLRGRTRISGGIDEIGWLFSKSEGAVKLDADEIYKAMNNSFLTIRSAYNRLVETGSYNIPSTIFCNISSPSSSTDKIVRLVQEAETNKTIYAFHYSTFEMNPLIRPSDLEEEERNNPEGFKRDFLAVPPDTSNAFITDREALLGCIDPTLRNLLKVKQTRKESKTGVPMVAATVKFRPTNKSFPRILAIDAGHTRNSFSGALMSVQPDPEDDGEDSTIFVLEGAFEVVPEGGHHINMQQMYDEVITPIIEEMNVKLVAADRWNSLKLLQDIENDHELPYFQYSVSYQEMTQFRDDIYTKRVRFPNYEKKLTETFSIANKSKNYPFCMVDMPISHFLLQALTVEDILNKKVEKGLRRTDDIWRSAALAHAMCSDPEIREQYLIEMEESRGPIAIGVVGSYNGLATGPANLTNSIGVIGSMAPVGQRKGGGGGYVFARSSK